MKRTKAVTGTLALRHEGSVRSRDLWIWIGTLILNIHSSLPHSGTIHMKPVVAYVTIPLSILCYARPPPK